MRTADFAPLYRSVVGFDRPADLIEAASKAEGPTGYPPYNIETVGDDAYRIAIASSKSLIEGEAAWRTASPEDRRAALDPGAACFF